MADRSPIGWALQPLKKYATFSGRAPRAEFWWFMLFMAITYILFWFLMLGAIGGMMAAQPESPVAAFGAMGAIGIFMILFWLALLVPTIAVQVRRLHDTNRSGWWLGAFYLLYAVYVVVTLGSAFSAAADPSAGAGAVAGSLLISLVFLVYSVVLLVFFCLAGTRGANRYGPDPYGADVGEVFA